MESANGRRYLGSTWPFRPSEGVVEAYAIDIRRWVLKTFCFPEEE